MADYILACTGAQIDDAVEKALNPDASPTSGSTNLAESGGVADGLAGKADLSGGKVAADQASASISYQAGTAYTLALSDAGKLVIRDNASANTTVIPPNSEVAFPNGIELEIGQYGAGASTLVAGTGVTLFKLPDSLAISGRYGVVSCKKVNTDIWWLSGALG